MTHRMHRRNLLQLAGVAAVGLGGLPLSPVGAQDQPVLLRLAWWGSAERHERTYEALALFEERYPNIRVTSEVASFDGHFDKLAVQIAGGEAPDVFQMSGQYILDYAGRGALLDLNQFVPDVIDLSDWDPGTRDLGLIDGELAGIVIGIDTYAIIFDEEVFAEAGIEMPETVTWEEFATLAKDLAAALGEGHWGTEDAGGSYEALETFVRQRGKRLFSEDGLSLGFEQQDLIDWFTYWDDLRKAGAAPPADVTAATQTLPENSPLVMGQAPIEFTTASQFVNFQGLQPHTLGLRMYPAGPEGSELAQFIRPALYISAAAATEHPQESAELINFLLNDLDAAAILRTARGIPASPQVRALLLEDVDDTERKTFELIDEVTATATQTNVLTPPGGRAATDVITQANLSIGFGQESIEAAVERVFVEAPAELG
ncbi:MAG: ABC transporter substrate-binding protein [Thermomicrobiales bacterium]